MKCQPRPWKSRPMRDVGIAAAAALTHDAASTQVDLIRSCAPGSPLLCTATCQAASALRLRPCPSFERLTFGPHAATLAIRTTRAGPLQRRTAWRSNDCEGAIQLGETYTTETIAAVVAERGLKPGDRLWVAGDKIDNGPYRQGNSASNPAIYLRWSDIDVRDKKGKLEPDDLAKVTVKPGQGLSPFIEKVVRANFNYIGTHSLSGPGESGRQPHAPT